jgi:uncharacterized membrane protein (DUF441 family)
LTVNREVLILLLVLGLGLAGKNPLVTWAAVVLLGLKLMGLDQVLELLDVWGIQIGLSVLTVTVLVPFATGESGPADINQVLTGVKGLTAAAAGVLAAWLGSRGLEALSTSPEIITGVLVGTILGTVFLKGVPVGPLVAVGMAVVLSEFVG